MKEQTIYRSAEGKAKILTLHDEFISRLGIEHEDIYVETRYGYTHVLARKRTVKNWAKINHPRDNYL